MSREKLHEKSAYGHADFIKKVTVKLEFGEFAMVQFYWILNILKFIQRWCKIILITDKQRNRLLWQFGGGSSWVVRNNESPKNIESCGGIATEDLTTNTCATCVAVNRTAYRPNEVCKFGHIACKCTFENRSVSVQVDFPMSKLTNYLFVDRDKTKMMHKIGYKLEDSEELRHTLLAVIKKQYEEGQYKLGTLNNRGQRVQIDTILLGKRDHSGEMHKCHTGCVLWPYGKIKVTTPLIVDDI